MTDKNKDLLIKYIAELSENYTTFDRVGKSIITVTHFLDHVEKVNHREYKRYMEEHAALYSRSKGFRTDYLIDFFAFVGVGRKRKEKKTKALEKLSTISEKNQQKINEFTAWLPTHYDYSEHTIACYFYGVKLFFEYCNEFNQENVRRFVTTLEEKGLKPQTIQLRITSLETFAIFIGKRIVVKRPKVQKKLSLENVPTETEYKKFCEWLKTNGYTNYYLYVRMLATSGCRISEFLQMKWQDVLNGEVTLRCKGNKYRRIFFPTSLQKEVMEYIAAGKAKADDYAGISRFGERITSRGIAQQLKTYAKKAEVDVKKMHPHAFRHFFAKSYLARNKNDITTLADLLGHGSIDTTRIYTKKSYDEQKREYHKAVTW